MYCMCCKLRYSVPSYGHHGELMGLGSLEASPIKSVPASFNELTSFKESTQELLLSLLEGGGLPRSYLRESKSIEDLEETNHSEQPTEDEKLYKQLFRRIYIDNYSAERVAREQLRLLDRVHFPETLERILIETIDRTAIMYRSILKEKIDELRRGTSFQREFTSVKQIGTRELYNNFEIFIEILNTLIDYNRAIRSYAREADLLLRHLEVRQLVEPLLQLNEEWLHRRCIQTVLQEPFIRSICNLSSNLLKTKSLAKYQDALGIEALAYLVDCCFNEEDSLSEARDLFGRSSSHLSQDQQWAEDLLMRELKHAKIQKQRLECDFTPQFLKSIERKLRKKK